MYKKNDKVELKIIDISTEGLGVAKLFDVEANKNIVFFVKDALVGDCVEAVITKVNKNAIFAKTLKVIEKSQYRVEPKCNVANVCGGCQLLSLDYKKQLELKKELVKNNLLNIGKLNEDVLDKSDFDIIGMDSLYSFRNKIIVPFGLRDKKIISGYYAGRTHYIIDNNYCATAFVGHEIIIDIMKRLLKDFGISIYDEKSHKGIFRQLMMRKANETNELSITFIINDKNYNKNIDNYKKLANEVVIIFDKKCDESKYDIKIGSISININTNANNVLLGKESALLYGNDHIEDKMTLKVDNKDCSLKFHVSDLSFYQTNIFMTKVLYNTVFEFAKIKANERVLDLYCGIGTMTLFASIFAKDVVGIEVIEKAIENAHKNSILNNINNANFICRDLDSDLLSNTNDDILKDNFDVLIVDPPRKGLSDAVKKYIISNKPNRIVYVSCDSATLSRDLNEILSATDYNIQKIKVVDMFAHTMHVETVILLVRKWA